MTLPVIATPEAEQDLREAGRWIQQTSGRADPFFVLIQFLFDQIEQFPESHAIVLHDVRRARVGRTPYNLYYRILADHIEVLAVVHGRRDPSTWQGRI